jgi:hypothetical protein
LRCAFIAIFVPLNRNEAVKPSRRRCKRPHDRDDHELDINTLYGCPEADYESNVGEQLLIEALAGFSQSVFTEDFVMIPAAKHREEDRLAGERAEADSRCAPEVETIATTPGAGRLPGSGRVRDGAMVAPAEAFR